MVYIVFRDSENTIWVGTENGLSRYVEDHDHFINYQANTAGKRFI